MKNGLHKRRRPRHWVGVFGLYATVVVLILGGAAFLFFQGVWARTLEKAYLLTAGFFGVLFYAYWYSLGRLWFWKSLATIIPAHAAIVFLLIRFNVAFPAIDRLPGIVYSLLLSAVYGEWYVSNWIVENFRHRATSSSRFPEGRSIHH